jgi:DNA polymerase III subunit chi
LLSTPVEKALPKLLEKALLAGFRAVITAATPEQVERLNVHLWTYEPDSFLPHAAEGEAAAQDQPILLSLGTHAANGAKLLVVTDGKWPENARSFERILDMFDGNDADALQAARTRWTSYKHQGFATTYLRQTATGGWENKA